ncbi:MAG: CPBP family intramembrane glutamic endopeptidase [Spirochaetota bacterium]
MDIMLTYGLRVAPGIAALLLLLKALPRKAVGVRITVYIAIFIVIRDAMTPIGLWKFGTAGVFWIRFVASLPLLLMIAAGSGIVAALMLLAEPQWRARVEWLRLPQIQAGSQPIPRHMHAVRSLSTGLVGAALTAAPLLLVYTTVPIEMRGGTVAPVLLPGILAVALIGNFYEELLFRGFLQDYLQTEIGTSRLSAALISGIAFAAGHSFLAVTVTSVGAPLLLFALYEGIIAGLIRMRWGLLPAVLSHGGAILLLTGGFV